MAKIPVKKLSEKQLVELIKKANVAYHDNDKPIMSDAAYDDLINQLTSINPNSPILKKVGSPARGRKVTLKDSMGSLSKVRVGEPSLSKWLLQHKGEMEATDKLDGISASYGHDDRGYYLHTRGDGMTGTDISHLIPYVKGLGDLPKGHSIRGELAITKSAFKGKLASQYANARNLTAGVANRKGIHPAAKKVTFLVHEYVRPSKQLSKSVASLKRMGFQTVTVKIFKNPTEKQLKSYLELRKKQSIVEIDGLVLNVKGDRIALKDVNEVATAIVDHIEWNITRFGLLKPVVILREAVLLAGAKVKRATAHNAANVKEMGLGPGAIVSIIRSGEVIPYIESTITKAKPQFPPASTYEWDGLDIRSIEDDSVDQTSLIMSNFLSTIGVKQFKSNMMAKLVDAGIDSVDKLIKVNPSRLEAAGFGKKQADQLYYDLREALQRVSHPRLSAASGIFPAGFGVRRMTAIFNATGTKLFKPGLTTTQIKKMIGSITGIGTVIAEDFARHFPKYLTFLSKAKIQPVKTSTGRLTGKSFAFSGFRSKSLESLIESKGGQVTGVTKNTTYLITNDPEGNSEKLKKARKLGILIISPKKAEQLLK